MKEDEEKNAEGIETEGWKRVEKKVEFALRYLCGLYFSYVYVRKVAREMLLGGCRHSPSFVSRIHRADIAPRI